MKKPTFWFIISSFIFHAGFSETYVWEDYDDFSGSSLDSIKWGTKYLGGGIEPYVSGGKLILSATSGNPSATKVVKSGWEDIFQGDDGGQAWVYPKDSDIMGIEAEFLIPSSTSSMSGLQVGVASLYPLSYATAELNADPNSGSQYSQGFGFYHLANNGSEVEEFGTTQRDTSHRLGATLIDGIIKLYVDGEIRYQGEAGTFNTDMFYINGFNDYQSQGLAFELTADNVRVLRRVTTTNLDGSVLMLSSADDVSETLSFENGTFTSTFQDPTEGTFVDTDKSYILDEVSSDVWKITLEDGDTYSFDASTNSGTLVDYENGQIDESGSWNFSFERFDWEDYDDFSSGSLDSSKWTATNSYFLGNDPTFANGRVELTGLTSHHPHDNTFLIIKDLDGIVGVEADIWLPSDAPVDTGVLIGIADAGVPVGYLDLWSDGDNTRMYVNLENSTTDETIDFLRDAELGVIYKVGIIEEGDKTALFLNGEKVAEITTWQSEDINILFRGVNNGGSSFTAYLDNIRVLRRSQEATEPDPVTVVSDPDGQAVVVQVGDEYKWNGTLDGLTLWSVSGSESEGDWYALTAKFSGGKVIYGFDQLFADDVSDTGTNSAPYEIDENGYIKSLEGDGDYQYYNVVSVEDGVIGTIQNDQGVESVADDGVNQVDQWFFTTLAAAEEYYYSKVNPKNWMWFDHYPWVYSEEEGDWLYFYPSGGTLMYWSNKGQAWRQFN